MKPVLSNKEEAGNPDWLQRAVHHQREGEFDAAAKAYHKALLKATGLADKKGNNISQPDELKKWKRRRGTVMKRLGLEES